MPDFFSEPWFWAMMQFFAVLGTLGLIFWQLRIQTASHVIATLHAINTRWESESALKARYLYCLKWKSGDKEFDAVAETIALIFEEMGVTVRTNAVPKKVIWETHSWYLEHYFPMFEDGIMKVRKENGDADLYSETAWLYEQMREIDAKRRFPTADKTDETLLQFAEWECEAARVALDLRDVGHLDDAARKMVIPTSETYVGHKP